MDHTTTVAASLYSTDGTVASAEVDHFCRQQRRYSSHSAPRTCDFQESSQNFLSWYAVQRAGITTLICTYVACVGWAGVWVRHRVRVGVGRDGFSCMCIGYEDLDMQELPEMVTCLGGRWGGRGRKREGKEKVRS